MRLGRAWQARVSRHLRNASSPIFNGVAGKCRSRVLASARGKSYQSQVPKVSTYRLGKHFPFYIASSICFKSVQYKSIVHNRGPYYVLCHCLPNLFFLTCDRRKVKRAEKKRLGSN